MGNDLLQKKFDDIDSKIGELIEYCRSLRSENEDLKTALNQLEAQIEKSNVNEKHFSEREALIQSKIDGLLGKLNQFSSS